MTFAKNSFNLILGLADEAIRWKDTVASLIEDIKLLPGNVFVAASSVAYYGPFTGIYRLKIIYLYNIHIQI